MPPESPVDQSVTRILTELRRGQAGAPETLWRASQARLRSCARRLRSLVRGNPLVETDALVDDTFLLLLRRLGADVHDSGSYFGTAAFLMRRLALDWAKAQRRHKRGGDLVRTSMEPDDLAQPGACDPVDLMALDEALNQLQESEPRRATIVEMYFFLGLSTEEIAEDLGCGSRTVQREWLAAREWLARRLCARM